MLGRRSFVPRPLSAATMFYDIDHDQLDVESPPLSMVSDRDSYSSASYTDIPKTPSTAGLGGFEFHFDQNPVKGPSGPHLFHIQSANQEEEILSLSPLPTQDTPDRYSSLRTAVAHLDENEVRDWSPQQVADWLLDNGFDQSIVDKFLLHDIYGSVLLELEFEDLKELDISSFGKRKRVMSSILQLRSNNGSLTSPKRSPQTLCRPVLAEEAHSHIPTVTRRGRRMLSDDVLPTESVSIVGIEQVLPKPHICEKAEGCPTWQKRQRKTERIRREFEEECARLDHTSSVEPSLVGSSDILGPSALPITADVLGGVEPIDAQENVRQFLQLQTRNQQPILALQHDSLHFSPEKSSHLRRALPRLDIPSRVPSAKSPDRTPASIFYESTQQQSRFRAALINDPYHYGGVASPVDVHREQAPEPVTSIALTAIPLDPCYRNASQSVPPEMCFGAVSPCANVQLLPRAQSTQPQIDQRSSSFVPIFSPVPENTEVPLGKPIVNELDLAKHSGSMRIRRTTRTNRPEWQENFFSLSGTKLDIMHNSLNRRILETIDVDEYDVHLSETSPRSKLSTAFKRTFGAQSAQTDFVFTLTPERQIANNQIHFLVNTREDRAEWLRKIILAKALSKGFQADPF